MYIHMSMNVYTYTYIYEYIHIYTYMNECIYYLLLSLAYILKLLEFFWTINQVKVSNHKMNNITKLWSKWLLKYLVYMIYSLSVIVFFGIFLHILLLIKTHF